MTYPVNTFLVNRLMTKLTPMCQGQTSDVIAVACVSMAWSVLKMEGRPDKSAFDALMDMANFAKDHCKVEGKSEPLLGSGQIKT